MTADVIQLAHQADDREHVVVYDGRRLFLAVNPHREPRVIGHGWKRFVWRRDVAEAMRFSDRGRAEAFAGEFLPPGWSAIAMADVEATEPVAETG